MAKLPDISTCVLTGRVVDGPDLRVTKEGVPRLWFCLRSLLPGRGNLQMSVYHDCECWLGDALWAEKQKLSGHRVCVQGYWRNWNRCTEKKLPALRRMILVVESLQVLVDDEPTVGPRDMRHPMLFRGARRHDLAVESSPPSKDERERIPDDPSWKGRYWRCRLTETKCPTTIPIPGAGFAPEPAETAEREEEGSDAAGRTN